MNRGRRRQFLAAVGAVLAMPRAGEAQQARNVARIGLLASNAASNQRSSEAFIMGLRDLGYVDGRNLVIEYRDAAGQVEKLFTLAAELVALKIDVIVAPSTPAAVAARQATSKIPIVFVAVGDPVTSGLVTSLPRPGGNVTGLSALSPELTSKWLELLKEAVPGITGVALLVQPGAFGERTEKDIVDRARIAARALGLRFQVVEARTPADIDKVFTGVGNERAAGLVVPSTPLFSSERKRLVDRGAKNRVPTLFTFREYVDTGGLMSYGPYLPDLFRRAAAYVDTILKGAEPAEMPVEQPTKLELVINLATAEALGLTIPQSLLQRADEALR
jgi:putative ABC transport system substrate-binding protein